ncbi:MAG: thioredoxin family protein [Ilumatobacteraceae bacterium]
MDITLLYFDDCPNWEQAAEHLDGLTREFPDLNITHRLVDTDEDAQRVGFHGSPSILIDNVDVFAPKDAPVGLSCRMYQTPDGPAGSPTIGQLRDAVMARRSVCR